MIRWRGRSHPFAEAGILAFQEQCLGNLQAAAEIYRQILAHVPDSAVTHNNRGVVLQRLKRYAEALTCYDNAIALKPDYANAHFNRGSTLKQLNRYDEALASYEQAIALKPDHAEAYNNRGVILQELRRHADALASYGQAIAFKPAYAEAYNNRGIVLGNQGKMSEAETMFLKAIELKPDFADPWFNLANVRKYRDADHAAVKNLRDLLQKPGLSAEDREQLHFALGKICDDVGRYDEAFKWFRLGNQSRNTRAAYHPAAVVKMTDAIMEVFSPDFLSRPFAFASATAAPVFIVGMPRSGTTLLASILSNHRGIAMAGELPTLANFAASLPELTGTGAAYPQAARDITPAVAARLIQDYERRLRRDVGPEVPHVIDKNPLNFRHLGFILMLFPNARILHCTRDPLDTGLSNYFQRFPLYLDFSFDLRNIGHFHGEYVRLMNHWRTIPALKLMEVSYEDLIQNTEPTARQALAFIGLEWDERCLAPHTNSGAVETASQWQVRQPIYHHSVERWRHYEKHLAPLKAMLETAGLV